MLDRLEQIPFIGKHKTIVAAALMIATTYFPGAVEWLNVVASPENITAFIATIGLGHKLIKLIRHKGSDNA